MATNSVMKGLGLAGLAVAAWFLLDPKNGARRRRQIADSARELYDGAGQELGRLSGELGRIGGEVMTSVTSAVSHVGEMVGVGGTESTREGGSRISGRSSTSSSKSANGHSR